MRTPGTSKFEKASNFTMLKHPDCYRDNILSKCIPREDNPYRNIQI